MSEEILHKHKVKTKNSLTTLFLLIPPFVFAFVIAFYLFTKTLVDNNDISTLTSEPEYILGVEDIDN